MLSADLCKANLCRSAHLFKTNQYYVQDHKLSIYMEVPKNFDFQGLGFTTQMSKSMRLLEDMRHLC